MAPLMVPAALVLTLTVIALPLLDPAASALMLPLPLICAAPRAAGRAEAGVQVFDETGRAGGDCC